MKNKIKTIFLLLILPIVTIGSFYFCGFINSSDLNKTVLFNACGSLNTSSDRLLTKIETKNANIARWSDIDIYNYDFYSERFSVAFRIATDKFELVKEDEQLVTCSLSDIKKSTIPNNEQQNMSALKINTLDMNSFERNSIIVSESIYNNLHLKQGDELILKSESLGDFNLKVMDYYKFGDSGNSITNNRYLNFTYHEIAEDLVFVSQSVFEQVSNSYKAYITFGNDSQKLDACYKELTPFLSSNKAQFSFPDCSLNNFNIHGMNLNLYSESIYNRFKVKYEVLFNFLRIVGLVIIGIAVLCSLFRFSGLFINFFSLFKKFSSFVVLLYGTMVVGFGIIFSIVGKHCLYSYHSYDNFQIFRTPTAALQLLSVSTILYLCFFVIFMLIRRYFMKTVDLYNSNAMHFDDIVKTNLLKNEEKTPQLEFISNPSTIIQSSNKVLFFGSFTSPCQSAGACRTLYFCKLFKEAGYTSFLSSFMNDGKAGDVFKYDSGIYFTPYSTPPKNVINKFRLFVNPTKYIKQVLKMFEISKPEIIVVYSVMPILTVLYLKKYCKKHHVKIIFDVVESQVLSQQSFTSFFTYYLQQRLINTVLINKRCNVISISSYLNDYYKRKKIKSLLIPFVSDTRSVSDYSMINNSLKKQKDSTYVLYAGNPKNKRDLLFPIFKAINSLDDGRKKRIVFIIAGVNAEQLLKTEGVSKEDLLSSVNNIVILGKVDHYLIEALYSLSDFTILVKPNGKRFSMAGFPTKVSESLAHGVTPIVNLSSDLELYLNDTNSIIINGDDCKSIKDALEKAIDCPSSERELLRKQSRQLSMEKLDIFTYVNDLKSFLE